MYMDNNLFPRNGIDYPEWYRVSAAANNLYPLAESRIGVRVVVAGDRETGKSCLISGLILKYCSTNDDYLTHKEYLQSLFYVPPLLPPWKLLINLFPDPVQTTVVDTSSSEEGSTIDSKLVSADAILVTFDCTRLVTLTNLRRNWLDRISKLDVPIILVGCKSEMLFDDVELSDLSLGESSDESLDELADEVLWDESFVKTLDKSLVKSSVKKLIQEFPLIENCVFCSTYRTNNLMLPFYCAQKAVLFPSSPIYRKRSGVKNFTLKFSSVLEEIFNRYSCIRVDGVPVLSPDALNDIQVNCFMAPLLGKERSQEGLTLFKFQDLIASHTDRLETIWTLLRKYGFNDRLDPIEPRISNVGHGSAMEDFCGGSLVSRHTGFVKAGFRPVPETIWTICWPVWQVYGSPPWSATLHRQHLEHASDQDHDWAPTAFKRLLSAKLIKFTCLQEVKDVTPSSLKDITAPVVQTFASPVPTANPGIKRELIPEDQRRGLLKWILEEKIRKIKTKDSKSIPHI